MPRCTPVSFTSVARSTRPTISTRSWPCVRATGSSSFASRSGNWRGAGEKVPIRNGRFELRDTGGGAYEPLLATVNRTDIAPYDINSGDTVTLQLVFELPLAEDPLELEYDVLEYIDYPRLGETIVYEFN